jgi:hypothetical protein
MRAPTAVGWRSRAGVALAVVARRPSLWLLGSAAFLLRGGILLLALPIVVVPTLVEARLLIGTNLGSSGFAPGFIAALAVVGGLVGMVMLIVLALIARIEVDAFVEFIAQPEAAGLSSAPAALSADARGKAFHDVLVVQIGSVVAIGAALVPLLFAVAAAVTSQLVQPTGTGDIYLRVLSDVRVPVLAFLAVFLLIEMLSASLIRARLWRAAGIGGQSGRLAFLRQPLRLLLTALTGWAAMLASLVPAFALLLLAWQQVRATYLGIGLLPSDENWALGAAIVTGMLVLAFVGGLLLTGFASALRAALWTAESLG